MNSNAAGRVSELDGLRGVAILLVMLFHAATVIDVTLGSWLAYLMATTRLWWTGVDLFFVISGFLITSILIKNRAAQNYYHVFYLRRALRILPLYYALLLIVLIAGRAAGGFHNAEPPVERGIPIWSYFCFVQNWLIGWLGHGGTPYLGVTWSLAIEEQFYLIMPLACRVLSLRTIAILAAVGCIVTLFTRQMIGEVLPWASYKWTVCRADGILMGIICAVVCQSSDLAAFVRRARSVFLGCWAALFACLLVATKVAHDAVWIITVASAFYAVTVLLFVLKLAPTWMTAIVHHKVLNHFGNLCYGLYLFHSVTILGLFSLLNLEAKANSLQSLAILASAYLAAWGLALLSWRFLEMPLIRIGHRLAYQQGAGDGMA